MKGWKRWAGISTSPDPLAPKATTFLLCWGTPDLGSPLLQTSQQSLAVPAGQDIMAWGQERVALGEGMCVC